MKKIFLALVFCSFLFAENFLNLKITNKTLMTEGQFQISQTQPIYARGGFLMNKNTNNYYYLGLKTEGEVIGSESPLNFGLFVDTVHVKDNTAIPIGISMSGFFKQFALPVFLRAEYEYAPDILCFDNTSRFSNLKVETGIRFIVNGEVFVGYRHISFNKNYDSHMYVGVGFVF